MRLHIEWSGTGEPLLLLPGWNTTAATVRSWLPDSFLARYNCGIPEWPGTGNALDEPLPDSLEGFLDALEESLPLRPIGVVGFCLGGVAAWAFAQRHPGSVRCSVLVESPLYFPLVLTPLLVPGIGEAALRLVQGLHLGRMLVGRLILQRRALYPEAFLDGLFDFQAAAAIHYLRLFSDYGKSIRPLRKPHPSPRTCWQLSGEQSVKVLAPSWGHRHRVDAIPLSIANAGHFPAVEAPAACFERIQGVLAGA